MDNLARVIVIQGNPESLRDLEVTNLEDLLEASSPSEDVLKLIFHHERWNIPDPGPEIAELVPDCSVKEILLDESTMEVRYRRWEGGRLVEEDTL